MAELVREKIYDVLAERYPSTPMVNIWSVKNRIIEERRLWIAGMKAMDELGFPVPAEAIAKYEAVIEEINLEAIHELELQLRHDVMARARSFNNLAEQQYAHVGFTSRDLTDNIEQFFILRSLQIVRDHFVAVLARMRKRALEFKLLDMAGRSHNITGQTITMGKRFANWADELIFAFRRLEEFIVSYPLRGIKGPMGTMRDLVDLLGSKEKAFQFEEWIRNYLGFSEVLDSVAQVYPRSFDFNFLSILYQLASAPANMATTFRLMAGHGYFIEGFSKTQAGSSIMPHKLNPRTCERIKALLYVLRGFLSMTESLVGDQWNEGDVSCSVARRVALPGAFFAIDGLSEATLTVLDEMEIFPQALTAELQQCLTLLSSTKVLNEAMRRGLGREDAHRSIRNHVVAALYAGQVHMYINRLAEDPSFPLDLEDMLSLVQEPDHGAAPDQVDAVCAKIEAVVSKYPEAALYNPEPIL